MIYLLFGPSGSGKTTLGNHLKKLGLQELISTTTRQPRAGEVDGLTYYFVTREQFNSMDMLEWTEYGGNLYGTSVAEVDRVLQEDNDAFVIVDRHGCVEFKRIYGDRCNVIYVYCTPEEALRRMRIRGDSEETAVSRMEHAFMRNEFNNIDIADYCIVNKDLIGSLLQLRAIVN